jgi:hypothetical protein
MSLDEPAEPLIEPAVRPDALEPAEPDAEPEAEPEPAEPDAVPDAPEPDEPEPVEPEPVEPEALEPVDPELEEPEPEEPEPELMLLLAPPNFAFFSTKPPPAPVLLDALLELLPELPEPPELVSRCRQPVAVICPAMSLDERPVDELPCEPLCEPLCDPLELDDDGWLLCGVDELGDCAASVPHSATPLHSVTAHCQ